MAHGPQTWEATYLRSNPSKEEAMDTRAEDRKKHGFYRARLDDSDVIYKLSSDPSVRKSWVQRLKIPVIYVFVNDAETAMVAYEPAYGDIRWLTGHALTESKGRGRALRDLFWSSGIWVFENTRYEVITGVVPPTLRRYGLFLAAMGATRQFEHFGTVMYTFHKDQVAHFRARLNGASRTEAPKVPKET